MLVALGIILFLCIFVVGFLIQTYNKLKRLSIGVDQAFANLDAILNQRVDQLDNLIQTIRVATDKELEALNTITRLRAGVVNAVNADEKLSVHNHVSRELPAFLATVENYPELKFNENFMHLQRSINHMEEQIQAGRRTYNAHTSKYNEAIAVFPQNIIAGMFQFTEKPLFETAAVNRENPDVKTLFSR